MTRESTRVLVTGGAGFLGGHLVRALLAGGHAVRVLDDLSTGRRRRLEGLRADVVQADVREPRSVRRALEGAQVVFHLAGVALDPRAGRDEVLRAEEINVGGTLNLLHAAAERPLRRMVIVGSAAVYGRPSAHVLHEDVAPAPVTLYGVQRLAIEQYARVFREGHGAHPVPSTIVRLFRCFGPHERWDGERVPLVPRLCRAALEGNPPPLWGDGSQSRDLVYVDNAIAGLLAVGLAEREVGPVYNVASGEAVSVRDLWRLLAELAGYHGDAPEPVFTPPPGPEPPMQRASIARARHDLGYVPSVGLREGLRRTLEHYRAEWRSSDNGWFTPAAGARPPEPPAWTKRAPARDASSPFIDWPSPATAAAGSSGARPAPEPPEMIELDERDLAEAPEEDDIDAAALELVDAAALPSG